MPSDVTDIGRLAVCYASCLHTCVWFWCSSWSRNPLKRYTLDTIG